jgi:hypothetical protein
MWSCIAALACAVAGAEEPRPPLDFLRVHVPPGRLEDVPLGTARYVPMSAAEFEAAVARLGATGAAAGGPRPLAARSRYELAIDDAGRLAGRVTFDLAASAAAFREVDLGAVRPGRCSMRTAAGTGEAVVFGRPDGTVAVRAPEAGTYEVEVSVPPSRPGAAAFTVPLVPALATAIVVRPPAGARPVVAGDPAGRAVVSRDAAGDWLIEFGPAASVGIAFGADDAAPLVAAWTDAIVLGGRVETTTVLVPRSAWVQGELAVEKPAEMRLVAVELAAASRPLDWTEAADGRSASIILPREVAGGREPVSVRGVSACGDAAPWRVPFLRAPAATWGGGGTRIEIDPALGVIATAAKGLLPVTPEVAVRWPLPTGARRGGGDIAADVLRPAILHFEQQAAEASLALTLRPRQSQLDVARVTTVEISPGQVVGRAACDVRVVTGEAFAVTGRIGPGWIIDAVEMAEPFDRDADAAGQPSAAGREVDWRITRGRDGGPELRVGLAVAATPRRSLGLRVTGHRGGVPLGESFRTADMDMVRFEGEATDTAVIDFNVGPEAVVEIGGAPLGVFAVPPRLARLVEPGTLRGRLPGGSRAADREARLVQRRPPLDARVAVALAVRDERLAESFTLTCRPAAAAVDSIVVHFSEPMGDGLAWSLLEPSGGSLVARRLDAADTARGEGLRVPGCAESWLVEITPAFTEEVKVRADRDVAFREARPVPLAWVEGATNSDGTVLVRDTGPARPTVLNRRLRELPPAASGAAPQSILAEFAFSAPRSGDDASGAAAELLPAAGADGRAWTWVESLTCRCHESGRTECEATYDIENHGRDSVSLSVLPGRLVEAVLIDGSPVPIDSLDGGGAARVPLPPHARRVRLVVRTLAAGDPRVGWWRIDPVGSTIDVPSLEQRLDMLLPPGLEIGAVLGGYRAVDGTPVGLAGRLLAARSAGDAARVSAPAAGGPSAGFEPRRFVPTSGPDRGGAFLVVRRSLVTAAALVAGLAALLGMRAVLRRSAAAAVLLAAGVAAATVWLAPPLETVARAAWWGVAAAAVWRGLAAAGAVRGTAAGLIVLAACAGQVRTAVGQPAATESLKVFLTPGNDGGLALVPEPLYRALLRETGPATASVRIVRCRVLVEEGAVTAAWRLRLDLDADAGGSMTLDQGPVGGRWEPVAAGESTVQVQDNGRLLRIATPTSGSRRIELRIVPAIERSGCLETAAIRLPPAASSRLDIIDATGAALPSDAAAIQCDRAAAGGPFVPMAEAPSGEARFDLSGAERVRLVRPLDRRHRLAAGGLTATSENDLVWDFAGCRVRARFDVAGDAVVRAVVVAADPGLEPFGGVPLGQVVHPLGGGRHLLERTAPEPGAATFGLELRLPLNDPVGTFPVPRAWLEGLDADTRTVRLAAAPDFVAILDPLPGQSVEARAEPAGAAGDVRRYDAGRSAVAAGPLRLAVSRRRQEIRGSQALTVSLEDEFIGLRLRGRIDATARPLLGLPVEVPAGCEIERVTLREDDADVALRPPLDVQWSTAGNRMTIVLQQPRAGRYRLEVEGRLRLRPAARGRLPLMRAELAGDTPLVVSWSRRGQPPITTVEVPAGAEPPEYALENEPPVAVVPADVAEAAPPVAATPRVEDRVEQAVVTLTIDDRGRLRGVARFDLVTGRQTLRLRLPARMRLFDALIDGRQANVQPETADAWDVQLHAADWPRTLMLLFTGELDAAGGAVIRLLPPTIEGLACDAVLWQVEPPPGMRLRVAEPALPLVGDAWERAVGAGRERVAAAFTRVLAPGRASDDLRLREFADMRTAGRAEPREDSWLRAMTTAGVAPVRAAAKGDGGLTVRLVRREDPSAPQRTAATAVLAAVAVWTILAARRRAWIWERLRGSAAAATPWLLIAAGVAWVTTLAPVLPGWLLVATGVVAVVLDWKARHDAHTAAASAAGRGEFPSTRSLPLG